MSSQNIQRFTGKKVLVVGDVMIDAYLVGPVDRMSPEAPVPVVNLMHKESRLGGAANVALNVQALQAVPLLCSVIGADEGGDEFMQLLAKAGIDPAGIVRSKHRKTTAKTRVIGNNHQLLRLDYEHTHDLEGEEEQMLLEACRKLIPQCDVVVLEDYNKGVLTPATIPAIISIAAEFGKPVAVDPKQRNFLAYKGVTLFKPNLKELREGITHTTELNNTGQIADAMQRLRSQLNAGMVMSTLSEKGVMITDGLHTEHIPAHVRNIADVSGAGDTVIAVAALALACELDMRTLAALANLAGGLVCEDVGVVPIEPKRFAAEAEALNL